MKRATVAALATLGLAGAALAVGCQGEAPPPPPARPSPPPPRPAPPAAPPLCVGDAFLGIERPPRERRFPADFWIHFLLAGYGGHGEIARPTQDCRGGRVAIDYDGCPSESPHSRPLSPRPVADSDVVVATVADDRRLVWIMTDHFSDGQAQGPVALVQLDRSRALVRALGVLRAYPSNVELRLHPFAGGTVLVADSSWCDPRGGSVSFAPASPSSEMQSEQSGDECARSIRLVPLVGDRFLLKGIFDDYGNCLDSSGIKLRASGLAGPRKNGLRYHLSSSINFTPDGVSVREELAVDRPSAGGSYVMREQAERQVRVQGGGLVSNSRSLLARWLERSNEAAPESRRDSER